MNNVDQYTIEEIQNMIIDICRKEYLPTSADEFSYFIIKNDTAENVKANILNHLEDPNLRKNKYLDMAAYVMQVDKDVFISIT